MGGRLQISVLGELRVARDSQLLSLPASKKTRALLAYLTVVGRPQRRDHLCELLWELPDDPRASLRWSLHKLRRVTNSGEHACLTADRDFVVLNRGDLDLDLDRVTRIGARELSELDVAALEGVAAEFRGEFLEGLDLPRCSRFESWRVYHARSAARLRCRILRELVHRLRDDPERALPYAEMLGGLSSDDAGVARSLEELAVAAQRLPPATSIAIPAVGAGSRGSAHAERFQEIRFCRSPDGVQIAYAVCGRGPPIVRAAHWMSHLQHDWESPVWRHWIDGLSDAMTLVRYDERGNGLSDWEVADFSFSAMVADLESVVDAARLDRFMLLGVSQSCAVSVAYAVRHPERVSRLVLYGGFVKGWFRRGDPSVIATHQAMTTLIREGWGQSNPAFRQLFTAMFIPGGSEEQAAWFNELQRVTTTPANACCLHDAFGDMDVSALLPQVSVPTLVLHARHDAAVPFQSGRQLAMGIPGARFVDLDSANHILLADEPAFHRFLREVKAFMHETSEAAAQDGGV